MARTGWYNRNKLGNSVKHESHRHSLAAKGIKTTRPKGVKNVSFALSPTPNFDMVKKSISLDVKEAKRMLYVLDELDEQHYLTESSEKLRDKLLKYLFPNKTKSERAREHKKLRETPYPAFAEEGYDMNKKTDMVSGNEYLLAVKVGGKQEVFRFPTKIARSKALKDMKKIGLKDYATSETKNKTDMVKKSLSSSGITIFKDIVRTDKPLMYDPYTRKRFDPTAKDYEQKLRQLNIPKSRLERCRYALKVADGMGHRTIDPFPTLEKATEWVRVNLQKKDVFVGGKLARQPMRTGLETLVGLKIKPSQIKR